MQSNIIRTFIFRSLCSDICFSGLWLESPLIIITSPERAFLHYTGQFSLQELLSLGGFISPQSCLVITTKPWARARLVNSALLGVQTNCDTITKQSCPSALTCPEESYESHDWSLHETTFNSYVKYVKPFQSWKILSFGRYTESVQVLKQEHFNNISNWKHWAQMVQCHYIQIPVLRL